MNYRPRYLLLLPLLCHCYSAFTPGNAPSDGPSGGDASVADGVFVGDSSFADGVAPGDGAAPGIVPYTPAPLRNTIWVLHDNLIEERRIDDLSVILDTQEVPFRDTEVHVPRVIMGTTENGCLITYDEQIHVYDRRHGWAEYDYPEHHLGRSGTMVVRDGYWLMPGGEQYHDTDGVRRRRRRRFHINTGRVEIFEYLIYPPRHNVLSTPVWMDGLDGSLTTRGQGGGHDLRTWLYQDGFITAARGYHNGFETGPLMRYGRTGLMMRDGGKVVYGVNLPRGPDTPHTWRVLGRDRRWDYFIRHEREDWYEPYGSILPTADDELFFITAEGAQDGLRQTIEVTIRKTTPELEEAETVLGPVMWAEPVRMTLGDPVQRIAATPR